MTENDAIDKLKNMRLFMQIEDNKNECKFTEDDYAANKMAIHALEEVQQYRKIGTVEECLAAVEMRTAKKPIDRIAFKECPTCGHVDIGSYGFCERCGQRLDWRNDDENTD